MIAVFAQKEHLFPVSSFMQILAVGAGATVLFFSEARAGSDLLPSANPAPQDEEPADSWFTTGFSDFSLHHLNFILPSYIQVGPEGKLTGDLKWDIEGFSQATVHADVSITNIQIDHRGLADHPVNIPDLSLRGAITWNRSEKIISFQNLSLGRGGVMARLDGAVSYKNAPAVRLSLFLPEMEIQQVLNALPADLIPKLMGAQVSGTIAMNMSLMADPANPASFKWEPGIRVSNYHLFREPPGISILALKSDAIHEIRKNGVAIRRILLSRDNPRYVSYDQLGEYLRKAILKAEDAGFFNHSGFNLEAIRMAMVRDLSTGEFVRGGSTITQQLAKNLFLTGQKTLSRKLQEAMLAYALEQELTKQKILEIYANIIEWGVDVYGIAEAADHYFSKPPSSLTNEEAKTLASIIRQPKKRDFNPKSIPFPSEEAMTERPFVDE